jgi:hypothetical protein
MVESKVANLLRRLASGSPPAAPPDASALSALFVETCRQGLVGLVLGALDAGLVPWAAPLREALVGERRRTLARTLGQCELGARAASVLAGRGLRAMPLKGVAIAETVCEVESDRPMSDTDLLVLDRFADGVAALAAAGFVELARADHAWAFRDPLGGRVLELHRSPTTAPGLFPLDREGLWARRRPGRRQQPFLPSAEDLLLQLALHASFQHGFVLSLVQWLDFRRLLEHEAIDFTLLRSLAASACAETPLAAALLAAEAVVGVSYPPALAEARARVPRGLRRWLDLRRTSPLDFVAPTVLALGRVRWRLLAGRRAELLWRTLVLPETPGGDVRLAPRLGHALRRAFRLVREG